MKSRALVALAATAALLASAPVGAEDLGSKIGGAFTGAYKGLKEGVLDAYEGGTEGAKDVWGKTKRGVQSTLGNNQPAPATSASAPAGSADDLVFHVQRELQAAGYTPGSVDGVYGPQTAQAIRAYQANNGLVADGRATMALLDHLRSHRAIGAAQPAPRQAPPPAPQGQPLASPQTQPLPAPQPQPLAAPQPQPLAAPQVQPPAQPQGQPQGQPAAPAVPALPSLPKQG